MKKKVLNLLIVVTMTMGVFIGCGKETADNKNNESNSSENATSERDFSPERLKEFADTKGLEYSEEEASDIGNDDMVMMIYSASKSDATYGASVAEVPEGYKDYLMSGDSGMTILYEDSVTDAESYLAFSGAMLSVFTEKANYIAQTDDESLITQDMVNAMNPIYALMSSEDGSETYMLMAVDGSYLLNLGATVDNFSEFAEIASFFGLTVSEDELQDVPEFDWGDTGETDFTGEGMSDEEIAENLFKSDALSEYEVEDFDILSVEVMTGSDREKVVQDFYPDAGEEDILAIITYDVKPFEEFYEDYASFGGEEDGQWVRNKESYIYIEHTDSGYFLYSYGTNW